MRQEIRELIIKIVNDLNYDTSDEELFKYLFEKGVKTIDKIEKENYSLEQTRQLLIQNIPIMMDEYVRLNKAISEASNKNTKFGVSINYQLIDLFEIAKTSVSSEDFLEKKNIYLSSQSKIFPGLNECSYDEIMNIYNNILKNCDCITPEVEAKMGLTINDNILLFNGDGEINQKVFNFEYLDKIIMFAKENNMLVRLHTLVWHQHFPQILENLTREQCIKFLDAYFSFIVNRYGEDIFVSIDVLNEICADINSEEFREGKVLRESPWKIKLGDKYYLDVLKLVRKYFPNSNLVYNEYDETNTKKRRNMIFIINEIMLEEIVTGVKLLDSIGLQSHYHEYLEDDEIKSTYRELSQTGKSLQVSELDILKINSDNDMQVNRVARTVLDCAASYGVDYITCWGPSSKISWKSNKVRTFLNEFGNVDQSIDKIVNVYSIKKKANIRENSIRGV